MYVYRRAENQLWTVGFYSPGGEWFPESDHNTPEDAAKRVHYLNGGKDIINTQNYRFIELLGEQMGV